MDNKTLVMHFTDQEEKNYTIRLDDPKDDIDGRKVKAAMNIVLEQDIFARGLMIAESAEIVTRTVQDLPLID